MGMISWRDIETKLIDTGPAAIIVSVNAWGNCASETNFKNEADFALGHLD
jgi:hypothetical protein